MRFVLNKHVVFLVLVAFASYVLPVDVIAGDSLEAGKRSAASAAEMSPQGSTPEGTVPSLRYAIPMGVGYAQPDTTEFEFPEEEEKHLYRDIAVFVIISGFAAYFLIKVFLEGDEDDEGGDDGGGGKPGPPI